MASDRNKVDEPACGAEDRHPFGTASAAGASAFLLGTSPFGGAARSPEASFLAVSSAAAAPDLDDDLSILDLEAFEFADELRVLLVLVEILGEVLLAHLFHDIVGNFLTVDFQPVERDHQHTILERRLEVGFAVQVPATNHGKANLIERDADLTLDFIPVDLDVDQSPQILVLLDQGVEIVAGQDEGFRGGAFLDDLAEGVESISDRLALFLRHVDLGKLARRGGGVLINHLGGKPIKEIAADRHEDHEQQGHDAGDDTSVEKAAVLLRRRRRVRFR